jgi:hypothetical protein
MSSEHGYEGEILPIGARKWNFPATAGNQWLIITLVLQAASSGIEIANNRVCRIEEACFGPQRSLSFPFSLFDFIGLRRRWGRRRRRGKFNHYNDKSIGRNQPGVGRQQQSGCGRLSNLLWDITGGLSEHGRCRSGAHGPGERPYIGNGLLLRHHRLHIPAGKRFFQ